MRRDGVDSPWQIQQQYCAVGVSAWNSVGNGRNPLDAHEWFPIEIMNSILSVLL